MKFIFEEKLGEAKRSTKDKDIKNLKEALVKLIEYIKKTQKKLNNDNDVSRYILEDFEEQLKSYIEIGQTALMQKELDALSVLKNNKHILKKYYERLKDEDLENFDKIQEKEKLNGNEEEREMYEMQLIMQEARYRKSIISPQLILRVKREYAKQKVKFAEMKEYHNYITMFEQPEEEMIKMYVSYRKKELDKIYINLEKQRLMEAGKILKKYGLLESELEKINSDYDVLGMPELKYQMRATEEGDIGLEEIFEEKYVKGLNEEQLAILNAFWQNRLTKKIKFMNQALLTIETLNLWKDLLSGRKIEISTEHLKNIIYKSKICDSCYNDLKKACVKEIKDKENNLVCSYLNLGIVGTKFKEKYDKYFDQTFPRGRNNFCEDFSLGQANRNLTEIVYNTKDYKINELLLNIEANRKITNWGYIPEKRGSKNSLQIGKKYVLIAIDYPGFNNTLMFHIDREQLIEYFLNVKEKTVVPIYEGDKAEIYNGKSRGRQILMPLTEKRESAIISLNKDVNFTDRRYQYIAHLGNLTTKKFKKLKRIYPSRYVDLLTGKEGDMINGNFVPEQEKVIEEEKKFHNH